jgi:TolB protein
MVRRYHFKKKNSDSMKYYFVILLTFITVFSCCEKEGLDFSLTDTKVIFISRRIENSADWLLYSMNSDGTQQEKITDLISRCEKPVVSHSGNSVLFAHYTEDNYYELYLINIDGTNPTLIDRAKRYCGSADWSNDDTKIIYSKSRNESTDEKDLILLDLSTSKKETLTVSGNNISAKFNPNRRIVFCCEIDNSYGVWTMDIDGSDKQLIIPDASCPVWSPDGKKIAYISRAEIGSPQIFVADFDGSNSKQLTDSYLPCWDSGFPPFGNSNPQWTPDSKKIVFVSDINDGLPEIYIMNSDGTHQKRLTDTDRRNDSPDISSDGNFIIFSSNRDLDYSHDIFVMDINGKNQTALSKYTGDDNFPVTVMK